MDSNEDNVYARTSHVLINRTPSC